MTASIESSPPSDSPQRQFAVAVVQQLRGAGFEAMWAGGCVRDQLLGVAPKDYDVATSALPEQVREVFGKKRTLPIGAAFGVITVLGPKAAGQIEVATFRTDVAYSDGRRPDSVEYSTAEEDALRRDFTINGLFYDPIGDELIDFVGGQQDLQSGLIRAIGQPAERFNEDKLRTLRAVRFAAGLNFEIDHATAEAIRASASGLPAVSAERIGAEVRRMLVGPGRGRALSLLHELCLLAEAIPSASSLHKQQIEQRTSWLDRLAPTTLPSALCCLLHGVDADVHGSVVERAARALKYPNKEIDRAGWITKHLASVNGCHQNPWSQVQPIASHPGATELLATHVAIFGSTDGARHLAEKLGLPAIELDPPLLLSGDDLVREGFRPGPHFGQLLQAIRTAQLDGVISTSEQALNFAHDWQQSVDD